MNNQTEKKSDNNHVLDHNNAKIVVLKGKRIVLRLITVDDAHTFATWINNPDINQYLSRVFPIDIESEIKWIESLYPSEKNVVFAIETLEGELIGNIGLHKIDFISRTAVTGTMIGNGNFHGKGYGSEAKMLLLNYAFNTLNLRKINSEAISFNKRSINYSLKCGYVVEGVKREEIYKNGRYYDMVLLAVYKKSWIPLWKAYQKTGVLNSANKKSSKKKH